ncbi:MAG: hypothetical protein HY721_05025 [Planctomycetes bacterium]|nr:hypothetical protein [Planctomycetota bacterium]
MATGRHDKPSDPFPFDRRLKVCLQHFYPDVAAWLLKERPVSVREVDPKVLAVQERTSDKLLWVELAGKPDVALHVEFHTEGRGSVPEQTARFLLLAGLAKEVRERGARLASFVVYLDRKTYREDPGRFELPAAGRTSLVATYEVVKLWELDPRPILELESPGLCPLVPLMRGDPKELLVKSAEKIRKASPKAVPERVKRDLLSILAVFSARVIEDRELVRRVTQEVWRMGDNWLIDEIREEGLIQGRADEARRAVLRVLLKRFGRAPRGLAKRLNSIASPERLEALLDQALDCPSLDAFRRLVDGG